MWGSLRLAPIKVPRECRHIGHGCAFGSVAVVITVFLSELQVAPCVCETILKLVCLAIDTASLKGIVLFSACATSLTLQR